MGMDHGADEWASCPVAAEAGLWFRYGRQKRPGVTAASTFEAVLAGERSSTTRFLCWHAMWAAVRHGDLVRFHEEQGNSGRCLVVRVLGTRPIDLLHCSGAELEEWSRCEGWAVAKGRALGAELGPALWIRHELVWPDLVKPSVQLALF